VQAAKIRRKGRNSFRLIDFSFSKFDAVKRNEIAERIIKKSVRNNRLFRRIE
jgi:hypothetical protein